MYTRRDWLRLSLTAVGGALVVRPVAITAAPRRTITVYKSPTCGCCAKWVEHVDANGFSATVKDMDNVAPIKESLGVPVGLWSCHTGVVGAYVVEGHVPADVIAKLLAEKPKVAGLAVPGMPAGSPGMEGAQRDHFDVMAFTKEGRTTVYASR